MGKVVIEGLRREYGSFIAVDGIDLTIEDGEFLTLLGPSGCGKTTTLNMLAGLDRPDSGHISVGGEAFFDSKSSKFVETEHRNIGLVFQSYALWPHMTVRDNVAFALKLRRVPKAQREEKVREALRLVEMEAMIDRFPSELSGGQQQRVALARTLAYQPRLLLLDEPLSNLDAKLRDRARSWLRELQNRVRITTVFVTHDQLEALALSDRIAVMDAGKIVQLGTPREIYQKPSTPFVADFIGTSSFIEGTIVGEGADCRVQLRDGQVIVMPVPPAYGPGSAVVVTCRPERIEFVGSDNTDINVLRGRLVERTYLGARSQYVIDIAGSPVTCEALDDVTIGEDVRIRFPAQTSTMFAGSDAARPSGA